VFALCDIDELDLGSGANASGCGRSEAEALPVESGDFDTAVITLGLCTIPNVGSCR
jgi:hypothetical protein